MEKKKLFVIGVDEAGRGPLAGPIAVAAVAAPILLSAQKIKLGKKTNFENRRCGRAKFAKQILGISDFQNLVFLDNIKDSKKLSAKQREKWRKIICENFECRTVLVGPKIIDKIGIRKATALAVAKAFRKFNLRNKKGGPDLVLLDGSISAPQRYNQKTIIKGDEKVPLIAAASIIAKTCRDKKMIRLHKKFPQYCFDKHKGYGTNLHYKMLKKSGPSSIHRLSFLRSRFNKNERNISRTISQSIAKARF